MRHIWDYGLIDPYEARRRECGRCGMLQRTFGVGSGRIWDWMRYWETTWSRGKVPSCTTGAPAREEDRRPLILIDVDGVINVMTSAATRRRKAYHEGWKDVKVPVLDREFRIFCNPALGRMLRLLAREAGAELAWATMWEEHANLSISPLLGLPRNLPWIEVSHPRYKYAETGIKYDLKADAVVPWTKGRPFVWFEDEPDERWKAQELLAAGQPMLTPPIEEHEGLTAEHIGHAREWLLALGKPAPPAEPPSVREAYDTFIATGQRPEAREARR